VSLAQRVRNFVWKQDAGWREVIIIAAAIAFVIALIGTVS
jgi:anti-sigma-K factor RskA